jgi:general L-amino acid transport system permease protein
VEQGRHHVRAADPLSRGDPRIVSRFRRGTLSRRLWHDRRVRAVLWQAVAVAGVLLLGYSLLTNLLDNLARLGIASGFGFFDSTAGFGITMSLIPYGETSSYGRAFVVGLLNTLLVSALGIVCATVLGFLIGVARLSRNWLVARLAAVYIETLRNIPLLLQIFFWYFAALSALPLPRRSHALGDIVFLNIRGLYVPAPVAEPGFGWLALGALAGLVAAALYLRAFRTRRFRIAAAAAIFFAATGGSALAAGLLLDGGLPLSWETPVLRGFNFRGGWVLIPELVALLLALSLYTAAFIAEVVRAGIEAVPRGQTEAAASLGLTRRQTLTDIVIPQAMRVIIPPLTNQYLNLTKNSSLAAAIAYPELVSVFAGTVLNQTGQAVEVIAITMAVYLAISLTIASTMNVYNRRVTAKGGPG